MKQYLQDHEITDTKDGLFSDYQITALSLPTPPEEIETTKHSNGQTFKSVKGQYIKKRLNIIFSFDWDFEIISKEYFKEEKIVVIQGRLTFRTNKGTSFKEQFGKAQIETPFDIGDAFKSASTDSLKKCASEIGVCWDVYSKHYDNPKDNSPKLTPEEKQLQYSLRKKEETLEEFLKSLTQHPDNFNNFVEKFLNENEPTDNELKLIEVYKLQLR